ncbi:MAG: 50S ribosomal protein L23 [Deltaproteobacteria bacterium]|nr:50S ribosomal protein L23 [Deltaproteobacteria bacterium]
MEMRDVLIRPIITEKTSAGLGNELTYAFEVGIAANKIQIERAVAAFYNVEVVSVRTLIVRGKVKRVGRYMGKRSNWKKAYVTLAAGHTLPLYEA